jgi:hypothetical protein
MRRRFLEVIGVVIVMVGVTTLLRLAPLPVRGQPATNGRAPEAAAQQNVALETPWGEPNLEGIWTDVYETPLQRPSQYGDRQFLTEEEQAASDERRAAAPNLSSRLAPRGSEQDVNSAYSATFTSVKPTGRRTSLIVDPPDGRIPPQMPQIKQRSEELRAYGFALLQATDICKNKLAPCAGWTYGPPSPRRDEVPPYYIIGSATGGAGGAINRSDGPEDRGNMERCLGVPLPTFGGYWRIVQSPRSVSVAYDLFQGQGWNRTIPVTTDPHAPPEVRFWRGDSRGRWEGKTLVVDVTNFTPKTEYQGSRENLHLVERWTRLDANTLEYVVTIEDPTTWTRPWTVRQELTRQDDRLNRIYYEPRCHEGNYGMPALLAGARAEDKAFAEGRGPHPATRCSGGCGTGLEGER